MPDRAVRRSGGGMEMNGRFRTVAMAGGLPEVVPLLGSSVGATAAPGGRIALAAGSYTYTTHTGGHRSASIAAIGTSPLRGEWWWQKWHGPVTCLVVDGHDAWLAGPG